MKNARNLLVFVFAFAMLMSCAGDVEAGWKRGGYRSRGPRPATGIGSNLHRRFVLKQELKRVQQGKSVRSRGNILWYR